MNTNAESHTDFIYSVTLEGNWIDKMAIVLLGIAVAFLLYSVFFKKRKISN